jgi:tRNA (guanine-N7-)-methyltransferase
MSPRRVRKHVNPLSILKKHNFSGFKNNNPILVDVGACLGEFSGELMKKFPAKNFILFEIRVPLANKLREKFKDFENVIVFDGDAGLNFRGILEPCIRNGAKIEQIFVNFPDPWFKERHKKRRFINEKFLKNCAEWIPMETEFVFQTDQEFMFQETLEVVQNSSFSKIDFFKKSIHGIPTHWEKQKLLEGDKIWRMKFCLEKK